MSESSSEQITPYYTIDLQRTVAPRVPQQSTIKHGTGGTSFGLRGTSSPQEAEQQQQHRILRYLWMQLGLEQLGTMGGSSCHHPCHSLPRISLLVLQQSPPPPSRHGPNVWNRLDAIRRWCWRMGKQTPRTAEPRLLPQRSI